MPPENLCFVYDGGGPAAWETASRLEWRHGIYRPSGGETHLGGRWLDGVACRVYHCPDGRLRAVPLDGPPWDAGSP